MNKIILSCFLAFLYMTAQAQKTSFNTTKYKINKLKTTSKTIQSSSFNVQIDNLEAPSPNGDSYRSFLMKQKEKSKTIHPYKTSTSLKNSKATKTPVPIVNKSFGVMEYNGAGQKVPIYGGIPNDNTAAVSNDGLLLLSLNSKVYLHDLNNDSILYPNEYVTLQNVFNLSFGRYFDPKVIYDKDLDRFVLVFLNGNTPTSSEIMVGFSKTNNPIDGWHVYSLPGNPLNNNRWTDFPVIALSKDKLYFTANLIVPDVSWQVGFDGSILWEMDKNAGFDGDTSISPKLYSDVRFGDNYIRNLHCVQGADGNVEKLHLFSNRNFDIENDTIFLVSLDEVNQDSSYLNVKAIVADTKYGVPPNGRQADTDTSDASKGLQTNDARVLGAIQFEDEIQFVSNTKNFETGFSAIYHGTVHDLYNNPSITAHIIADEVKDFGYPNIAWTGNEACDREAIIAFNHTSFIDSAGISAIYFDNEGNYSDIIELRRGENIVDRINNNSYERWGDYFGMQRKYNEPGKVYTFGYTTYNNKRNFGWVNELSSPDTNTLNFTYKITEDVNYCSKKVNIIASGGVAPYRVVWNNSKTNESLISDNYCNGDTSSFTVYDSRDCMLSGTIYFELKPNNKPLTLFPNPTTDILAFQFTTNEKTMVEVFVADRKGAYVKKIAYQEVKKGLNELHFSTNPLPKGTYFVKIVADGKILSKNKFIKK